MNLVRNHSHWGAFLAEVEGGRIVGVRPFEKDPDPSHLINAIPDGVHSKSRIAQPMVRDGWLKHGPGPSEGRGREPFVPVSWDKALDLVAGELDAGPPRARPAGHHGRLAGLVVGWHLSRGAGAVASFPCSRRRLRRFGDELQLRLCARLPAAHSRRPAVGDRPADLVVVDRAARQADGAVRRRQSEEHAGEQGRLRLAFHQRWIAELAARRRRGHQHQSDAR